MNYDREIKYMHKQLEKAQYNLDHVQVNASDEQIKNLSDKVEINKTILDALEIASQVRHGRWIPVSDDDQDEDKFYCSICSAHKFFPSWMPLSRYCYNCGAKMDGKDDEQCRED